MIPLVDMHCHLCAGLDDGPATIQEAVDMCRMAAAEGTVAIAALAHQNERYPEVTPPRIRQQIASLQQELDNQQIAIRLYPTAEIMLRPEIVAHYQQGELLSVADEGRFLLMELPHGQFLDLRGIVQQWLQLGVQPILAHPERCRELLHGAGLLQELVDLGCLTQVNAESLLNMPNRQDAAALKHWLRKGLLHLIGSDGHSTTARPPLLASAYRVIADWAGGESAETICYTNGLAVLENKPLRTPKARKRSWLPW